MSVVKKAFELVNDWRDTLYYSAVLIAAICGVVFFNNDVHTTLKFASFLFWAREISRYFFWLDTPKFPAVAFVVFSDNLFDILWLHVIPPEPLLWFEYIVFPFVGLLWMSARYKCGGSKAACRTWWREMFDWPRKQKPPRRRFEEKRKAWESLRERLMGGEIYIPNPARISL